MYVCIHVTFFYILADENILGGGEAGFYLVQD